MAGFGVGWGVGMAKVSWPKCTAESGEVIVFLLNWSKGVNPSPARAMVKRIFGMIVSSFMAVKRYCTEMPTLDKREITWLNTACYVTFSSYKSVS